MIIFLQLLDTLACIGIAISIYIYVIKPYEEIKTKEEIKKWREIWEKDQEPKK